MTGSILNYSILVILLVLMNVYLILIVSLIKKYRQTKVRATLFLLTAILLLFATNIIEVLLTIISLNSNLVNNYITSDSLRNPVIFNHLTILTSGMFLLFIDYFENENISASRLSIYTSFIMAQIVYSGLLKGLNSSMIDLDPSLGFLASFLSLSVVMSLPIFTFYVAISCLKSIRVVKKYAVNSTQLRQLSFIQLAICLFYIFTIIFNMISTTTHQIGLISDEIFLVLFVIGPRLCVIIGSLILWKFYATTDRMAFLQPQRMYQLIVITKTGLPIYSYNFQAKKEDSDSILLSGGITAVKALLKEAVGTTSDIVAIKFKGREIMIQSYDQFGVFLIVDRISNFLRNAIISFGNEFAQQFPLNNLDIVDLREYKSADRIVQTALGIVL